VRYIKAVRSHLECDFTPDGERKESKERIERDWIILFATSDYTKHYTYFFTASSSSNDELDAMKKYVQK